MRIVSSIKIILSEDTDQVTGRIVDPNITIDDTLVTTWDGGVVVLAPSAANQPILFPKVAAGKYLVLIVWSGEVLYRVNNIASQQLSVKPNPAATPDPLLPFQKAAQPGMVFVGPIGTAAPLTSLFFSNPSATDSARVQVLIVGEAA